MLYFKDNTFRTGRLSYDEFTELFLVDLKEFIFLSDVELIGVPIGYCPVSEQNKRTMQFEQLRGSSKNSYFGQYKFDINCPLYGCEGEVVFRAKAPGEMPVERLKAVLKALVDS